MKSIYELARQSVNNHIDMYTTRLGQAEYASTHLATAMINGDWLPVAITLYDENHNETGSIIVPVPSLESAWRFVFQRFGRNTPVDIVDMAFIVEDNAYWFASQDIRQAYENVRYESTKERLKYLSDGKGDSSDGS